MDIPKEFLSKEFLSLFKTGEDVTGNVEKKKLYEQQIREESITQFAVCQLISLYSSTWEKSKKVGIIEDVRLPNR